jgi:hypothetical protein
MDKVQKPNDSEAHLQVKNVWSFTFCPSYVFKRDHLCGLVVRVLGYRSGGPGSIPGTNRKKNVVGLERGALSLVSTNWGATW